MAKKRLQPPEILPDPVVSRPDPVDALAPGALPDDGFVRGSAKAEVKSSTSKGMKLWLYWPARILLLSEPTRKLAEVAQLRGYANRKVERVIVDLHVPTRRIFFYPPDLDDEDEDEVNEDAFEVTYRNDGLHAEFNIRSLFQPRGLEVERGFRERYDVKFEPNSERGPALVFQLVAKPYREKVKKGNQDVIEDETKSTPQKAKTKRSLKAAPAKAESTNAAEGSAESATAAKIETETTKKVVKRKEQTKSTAPDAAAQSEGAAPDKT